MAKQKKPGRKLSKEALKRRRRIQQFGWPDPADHYIFNPETITIAELAKHWHGERGCTEQWLRVRCADEKWVSKRKDHFNSLYAMIAEESQEKLAGEMADNVVDANRRHIRGGRLIQSISMKLIEYYKMDLKKMRTGEAMRIAIKAMKDGVDIERKALGLADQVVKVQFTKDMAKEFLGVVSKYIQDPDVLENIVADLDGIVNEQADELQNMIEQESNPTMH